MGYNRNGHRRNANRSGGGSRWMNLRYAGTCKVCGNAIPAGTFAYWDSAARTVTCERIDCASADGLTETKSPTGPWDKWEAHEVLSENRLGSGAPVHPSAQRTTT